MSKSKRGKNKSNRIDPVKVNHTKKGVEVEINIGDTKAGGAEEIVRAIENSNEDDNVNEYPLVNNVAISSEAMEKIFSLASSTQRINARCSFGQRNIDLKSWPATNLKLLPKGRHGTFCFQETIPQFHEMFPDRVGYVRDFDMMCVDFATKLGIRWEVLEPFHFREPKNKWDAVRGVRCLEGLDLDVLYQKCSMDYHNEKFADLIRDQSKSCVYAPDRNPGPNLPRYTDYGHGIFVDGGFRGRVLNYSQDVYSSHLKTAGSIIDRETANLPTGWNWGYMDGEARAGLVYEEDFQPPSNEEIECLGESAYLVVKDLCVNCATALSPQFCSATAASNEYVQTLSVPSTTPSGLRRVTQGINEASARNFVNIMLSAAVINKARISIDVSYLNPGDDEFFYAFLVLLLIPAYILEEETERNCCIVVKKAVDSALPSQYERLSIGDIKDGVRFLRTRSDRPVYSQYTIASPNCSDTRYRKPFNIDDGANLVDMRSVDQLVTQLVRHKRVPQIVANAVRFIAGRVGERVGVYMRLSELIGMHAACIPKFWRDVNVAKPLVMQKEEITSFAFMAQGFEDVQFSQIGSKLMQVVTTIGNQFIRLREVVSSISEQQDVNKTPLAIAQEFAAKLDILTNDGVLKDMDIDGNAIISTLKKAHGNDAVKHFLRRLQAKTRVNLEASRAKIRTFIRGMIAHSPSTFGVSKYFMISESIVPDNTMPLYRSVFEEDDHPFRFASHTMKSVNADVLMNGGPGMVSELFRGQSVVRGHFSYDMLLSSDDSSYRNKVGLRSIPLWFDERDGHTFIKYNHFTVDARVQGLTSQFHDAYMALRGNRRIYVEPRFDYTPIDKLETVRVRFVGQDQRFSDVCLNLIREDHEGLNDDEILGMIGRRMRTMQN